MRLKGGHISGSGMKLLAQGAEAQIFSDGRRILKIRRPKRYRHPQLDRRLRLQRTKREATMLGKCPAPAPRVLETKDGTLVLSCLEGQPLRDVLDARPQLGEAVGRLVTTLHDAHIIHGDLTTSNLIAGPKPQATLQVLDFGLSFQSHRLEDKAVDLHVLREALTSTHHRVAEQAWRAFLAAYRPKDRGAILARYAVVSARGRNK